MTRAPARRAPTGAAAGWYGPRWGLLAFAAVFLGAWGCDRPAPRPPRVAPASPPEPSGELRIAASSNLKFVLIDLVTIFEESHPEATITCTPGSSGSLFAQLSRDGPFDLFLSADVDYPRKLVEQRQAAKDGAFEYAIGHLVVWVPKGSHLDVEQNGIEVLRDESVKKIAVASPEATSYGRAAIAALKSLGVHDAVETKLMYGESVAHAAQLVESGQADAGVIALSLVVSPALRGRGRYWQIPDDTHPPILQGGVVLRWAQDRALATEFREFLLSNEGSVIFRKYGFSPVRE